MPVSTKGRLLVATPPLVDPNFDRTVVLMLEHHAEGALGVVLNRPSEEHPSGALDRWTHLLAAPGVIFGGGPVEPDGLVGLAGVTGPVDDPEHLSAVAPGIYSVDLAADPVLFIGTVEQLRIFRGYAGWGAGQLEAELEQGAWIVIGARIDDLFSDRPTELWRTVLHRQEGRLSWLANVPDDLSAN